MAIAELMKATGASIMTCRRALAVLIDRSFVEVRQQGRAFLYFTVPDNRLFSTSSPSDLELL